MECDKSDNKQKCRQEFEANNRFKQVETAKLGNEVDNFVGEPKDKTSLNDVMDPGERNKMLRQQESQKLGDPHQPNQILTSKISIDQSSEWQAICNLNICNERNAHILEADGKSVWAFVQSFCALDPANPSFKIKLLNFDYFKYMAVGFSCKGHPMGKIPGLYGQSVGFDSAGDLIADEKSEKMGTEWKVGDVIECGIKFPNHFSNSESVHVKLYFTVNEQLVAEKKVLMPRNGYFPTVYMYEGVMGSWWDNGSAAEGIIGTGTKVKYFK